MLTYVSCSSLLTFLESQLCVAAPGGDHLINAQYAAFYHTFHRCIGIKSHVLRHDYIAELMQVKQVPVSQNIGLVILMDDLLFSLGSIDPKSADVL